MNIKTAELTTKLNKIKSIVPKMTTIDALKGVLVKEGYLIASDTKMLVKVKLEGTEGESFIIPDRAFDLLNNIPEETVTIEPKGDKKISIKTPTITSNFTTYSADMFPLPEENSGKQTHLTIDSAILLKAMKKVLFAVANDNIRDVLKHLYMQSDGEYLNIVGCDGCVIAWSKIKYEGDFDVLIPKTAVSKLVSIGLSGNVAIDYNKNGAWFVTEDYELFTRIGEGDFLRYKSVFNEMPSTALANKNLLLSALNRAKMCSKEKMAVVLNIKDYSFNVKLAGSLSDYTEDLKIYSDFGEALTIQFNPLYIIEALKNFEDEKIEMKFLDNKSPAVIVGTDDRDYKVLILPVNSK